MKLQRKEVKDTKSPFPFSNSENYSLFSFGDLTQDYYVEQSDGILFDLYILLDDKYQAIDRNVFSLWDMFGYIGGMQSIILTTTGFFVGIFSKNTYLISLLSSFYYIKNTQNLKCIEMQPNILNEEFKQPPISSRNNFNFEGNESEIIGQNSNITNVLCDVSFDKPALSFSQNEINIDTSI